MKFLYFTIALLLFHVGLASAQATKDEIMNNPNGMGGVYYSYQDTNLPPQTPAPKGYEAFYISHYGRHGSRYIIGKGIYQKLFALFHDAKACGALTPLGEDVCSRLDALCDQIDGRYGDLTPLGARQHKGIAERMFKAYPEVFKGKTSIEARSSVVPRCILSMAAFCEQLKELNPSLQITRDASDRYMSYIDFETDPSIAFMNRPEWKKQLAAFDAKRVHPERLINSLFKDKTYELRKVNPSKVMWNLYWLAVDMQDLESTVSFFDLFQKEEIFNLWECVNYETYVVNGPGGTMPGYAKPLLQDFLIRADKALALKQPTVTLRFGHDNDVYPFVAFLHFNDCDQTTDNPDEVYKVWTDYKIVTMAANVQMIFFRNKKDANDIIVKFMLNEHEKTIKSVKSDILPFYHWKDIRAYWLSLINGK